MVWFSFEAPDTNEAHYHHSNEQPAKFWLNLFRFFDYNAIELPAEVGRLVGERGTHIFCAPNIKVPADVHVVEQRNGQAAVGVGGGTLAPKHDAKHWIRQLTPPLALDLVRVVRDRLRQRGIL